MNAAHDPLAEIRQNEPGDPSDAVTPPPFAPPVGFEFPAALRSRPPRAKPDGYTRSSHVRRWQQTAINVGTIGAACIVLAQFSFVKQIAMFFTPFAFLGWIGASLCLIAIFTYAWKSANDTRLQLVRDGEPRIARVRSVESERAEINHTAFYALRIGIDVQSPSTGAIDPMVAIAPDQFIESTFKKLTFALAPGDYTTVLVTPGSKPTAQLYGLLGVDPHHELVLRNGQPLRPMGAWQSLGLCGLIVGGIALFLAGFYALFFCFPIEGANYTALLYFVGAGAAAAVASVIVHWLSTRSQNPATFKRILARLFVNIFGFTALAAISAIIINAKFDFTPGIPTEVRIQNFIQTTHKGIFREYKVEFTPLTGGAKDSRVVLPSRMPALALTRLGVLDVAPGALGMKWARELSPVILAPSDTRALPAEAPTVDVLLEDPAGQTKASRRRLCVQCSDGTLIPPSNGLAAYWRRQAEHQGVIVIPVDEQGRDLELEMTFDRPAP